MHILILRQWLLMNHIGLTGLQRRVSRMMLTLHTILLGSVQICESTLLHEDVGGCVHLTEVFTTHSFGVDALVGLLHFVRWGTGD